MNSPALPNYIRTQRRRAGLTQKEVAFLLGTKSSAVISRHERFKQVPELETLLAYEILFQTPVRKLFSSQSKGVEQKLRQRIWLLIAKLYQKRQRDNVLKKIEILATFLKALPLLGQA